MSNFSRFCHRVRAFGRLTDALTASPEKCVEVLGRSEFSDYLKVARWGQITAIASKCSDNTVEPDQIYAVAALGGLDSIESLSEGIDVSHSHQMLSGMLR